MAVDVLVVGLGFGAEFTPLYRAHPAVGRVGVVEPDDLLRHRVVTDQHLSADFRTLDEALSGADWDAVHIVSPVRFHHEQVSQVLRSGRHVAWAVPMATTLDDLHDLVELADASPGASMMMETSLFSREYLLARELRDSGRLGAISYLAGEHLQNLDGYPRYWLGYPPMHYITHALAPSLGLAEATATRVRCLGSSALSSEREGDFGPGFGTETALVELDPNPALADQPLTARITMSFFQLARAFQESFSVYGQRASLEWPQVSGDPMVLFEMTEQDTGRGRPVSVSRIEPPTRLDLLPEQLHPFAEGGHGGSHPHLVHEFLTAIASGNRPTMDAHAAAHLTAVGLCAHESAMRGGEPVDVPAFARPG